VRKHAYDRDGEMFEWEEGDAATAADEDEREKMLTGLEETYDDAMMLAENLPPKKKSLWGNLGDDK